MNHFTPVKSRCLTITIFEYKKTQIHKEAIEIYITNNATNSGGKNSGNKGAETRNKPDLLPKVILF